MVFFARRAFLLRVAVGLAGIGCVCIYYVCPTFPLTKRRGGIGLALLIYYILEYAPILPRIGKLLRVCFEVVNNHFAHKPLGYIG